MDSQKETSERNSKTPETIDTEGVQKKLKYPKSVFFIVSNEFCERFCYYGMRTILAIYLNQYLEYDQDTSTTIYHAFISFAYMTPIIGAIIADSWIGKFKTIIYLSFVYACGSIIISIASVPAQDMPKYIFTFLGLILIGFGTGGIKPCVSSFGGDQFVVPEQEQQLQQFFSVFYFAVNSGSFISTFVTPILREDVSCFGRDDCYPLAFGVPAVLMLIAIGIIISGKRLYKIKKPEGNVVLQVVKCIGNAISEKVKSRKEKKEKREHWLDYAEEKFGKELVEHIKLTLRVLVLFVPLPMYWALFEQQGSRWTFQATRMNGDMGGGFVIKPDQIQVFNPLLILVLIPLITYGVYPIFKKFNILQSPLQKMTCGGTLAGVAFLMSAFVELGITPTIAVLPVNGEAQLRVFNAINCPVTVDITGPAYSGTHNINALSFWEKEDIKTKTNETFSMTVNIKEGAECALVLPEFTYSTGLLAEEKALSYMIYENAGGFAVSDAYVQELEKFEDGNVKLRILYDLLDGTVSKTMVLKKGSKRINIVLEAGKTVTGMQELEFGTYQVSVDDQNLGDIYMGTGGVYSYILSETGPSTYSEKLREVTPANKVNILWQIPQYVTMTFGEVMFSITGLEFAFTQAPLSMKSVVTAGWLLTNAFGNIIVIIIAEAQIFENPMWEFVLFAGLMFTCMLIFFLMSLRYKYVQIASEDSKDNLNIQETEERDHQE